MLKKPSCVPSEKAKEKKCLPKFFVDPLDLSFPAGVFLCCYVLTLIQTHRGLRSCPFRNKVMQYNIKLEKWEMGIRSLGLMKSRHLATEILLRDYRGKWYNKGDLRNLQFRTKFNTSVSFIGEVNDSLRCQTDKRCVTASQSVLQMLTAGEHRKAATMGVICHCFHCKTMLSRASEVTCFCSHAAFRESQRSRNQVFFQTRNKTGFLGVPVRSRMNAVKHVTPSLAVPRLTSLPQDEWELVTNTGQTSDIQNKFLFVSNIPHGASIKSQARLLVCHQRASKGPRRGGTYSQNSVTGEVKLVAFSDIQSVLFFLRVSSTHVGVFHFWWQWAHGRTLWNDWNR